MNIIGRQDRALLAGLAVALIVVFAKPIQRLLDLAREVERTSGLALIPALIILTVVFLFHQTSKRWESKARAAVVADTLRRELADMVVPWKDESVTVTASLGVTVALPSEINCDALISRADAALYRAKDQGRNCVRLSLETAVA